MREYTTGQIVANRLRMRREAIKGAFLLLEGWQDTRVYGEFIARGKCEIIVTHGKDNALDAIEILDEWEFEGVLAVVDADFDHLESRMPRSKNAFLTDLHDLECMMLSSPALDKLLREYAPEGEKTARFRKSCGNSPVGTVLARNAMTIGYLRWFSLKEELGLKFEGLSADGFTDRKTLTVDVAMLITALKNHSQKHAIPDEDIKSGIEALSNPNHDPWQVSCGHDIIQLLAFGLRHALATRKTHEVKPENLESGLRLAYSREDFRSTRLADSVLRWQSANSGYRVLNLDNYDEEP